MTPTLRILTSTFHFDPHICQSVVISINKVSSDYCIENLKENPACELHFYHLILQKEWPNKVIESLKYILILIVNGHENVVHLHSKCGLVDITQVSMYNMHGAKYHCKKKFI